MKILPIQAPDRYDRQATQQNINALVSALKRALASGENVYLVQGEKLVMASPDGTQWVCGPDNAGNWTVTAA